MKKIRYLILWAALLATVCGCEKRLNTSPTDSVGSEQIFQSAESALAAVNGIYRCMYMSDWGTTWKAENGGIMAYTLASDLMGEDHIQNKAGSGWFYYDYAYGISSDYTYAYGRQGQCWNFFYTLISNANNIIANEGKIQDNPSLANYVVGQAFAIRAWCYLWLVQNYQQCDMSLPGVPLYTEPTTIESKGKGRGTVQDVYNLINADLDEALARLGGASGAAQQQPQAQQPLVQQHPSHIDYYVAQGIKARALLVQKDYQGAQAAAMAAMEKPGVQILPFAETAKVNDVSKRNVMWG
ncbi:MAG: RagB/SusD family nutrient uptake outer membrane protein, partial [Bacteroidales bacterium]|nr:RagB/SusD family nutrient uptake outer membrane protein [Bacteroidales bacterium]